MSSMSEGHVKGREAPMYPPGIYSLQCLTLREFNVFFSQLKYTAEWSTANLTASLIPVH